MAPHEYVHLFGLGLYPPKIPQQNFYFGEEDGHIHRQGRNNCPGPTVLMWFCIYFFFVGSRKNKSWCLVEPSNCPDSERQMVTVVSYGVKLSFVVHCYYNSCV